MGKPQGRLNSAGSCAGRESVTEEKRLADSEGAGRDFHFTYAAFFLHQDC